MVEMKKIDVEKADAARILRKVIHLCRLAGRQKVSNPADLRIKQIGGALEDL